MRAVAAGRKCFPVLSGSAVAWLGRAISAARRNRASRCSADRTSSCSRPCERCLLPVRSWSTDAADPTRCVTRPLMLVTPSANEMSLQPRSGSYAHARSEKRRAASHQSGLGQRSKNREKKKGAGRNKDQGEIFIEALRNIARRKNTVQGIGRRRPPRQDKIFRAWRFSGNIERERERECMAPAAQERGQVGSKDAQASPTHQKRWAPARTLHRLVSKEWPPAAEHRPSEPNRQNPERPFPPRRWLRRAAWTRSTPRPIPKPLKALLRMHFFFG
ncbi:hypothetical protein L1887_40504 [Cichorium endivia]|nr:hypothetical protein L1887_40504 [Cichorium endivia]